MININHFIKFVLEPTLFYTRTHSEDAMYLMLRTALTESNLNDLSQIPTGPGLGFFQIELETVRDIHRYLERRTDIRDRLLDFLHMRSLITDPFIIASNLAYNAALARLKYWMIPESIPSHKDFKAQAQYWAHYYNTRNDKEGIARFIVMSEYSEGLIESERKTH